MIPITGYEVGLYLFAGFMTLYGFGFWFMSYKSPAPSRNDIGALASPKLVFLLLGFMYMGFAHLTVYGAYAINIDNGWSAPCENVVVNSTDINSSTTTYSYANSCLGRAVPGQSTAIFTGYSWVLYILGVIIMVGLGAAFLYQFNKKW